MPLLYYLNLKYYLKYFHQLMAKKLGLAATKYDAKEKVEYAKRYFHQQGTYEDKCVSTFIFYSSYL